MTAQRKRRTKRNSPQTARKRHQIIIHIDGACRPNPGPGGWGATLALRQGRRDRWGGEAATTNNRMELTAAIMAFKRLKPGRLVQVFSDSEYVVQGMNGRAAEWEARGWKTAGGGAVANHDLWVRLTNVAAQHDAKWIWIRGHSGVTMNEHADQLAQDGLERALAKNLTPVTRLKRHKTVGSLGPGSIKARGEDGG